MLSFFGGLLNLVHKHVITLLPTIKYLQEQENAMGCAGGGCCCKCHRRDGCMADLPLFLTRWPLHH